MTFLYMFYNCGAARMYCLFSFLSYLAVKGN